MKRFVVEIGPVVFYEHHAATESRTMCMLSSAANPLRVEADSEEELRDAVSRLMKDRLTEGFDMARSMGM